MCRRQICVASIALMVCLVMAGAARAELVGQWKFDEGSGTTAYDSSGNGNDGTLVGGATWADGRFGGGIELDGSSGYVSVPDFQLTTDTITFVAWLNGWKGGDWAPLISSRVVGQCEMNFGDNDTLHYTWNNDSSATWGWTGGPVIPQDAWTMLAVTIDPAGATAYVYTDDDGLTQSTNPIAHIEETVGALQIGWSFGARFVQGIIDEAAVYDHALTEDEILTLAKGAKGLPLARGPNPANGAMLNATWVSFTWRPGDFAVTHDVYLGENFDDVNDGTGDTFRGNQASTMFMAGFAGFPYPDGLVPGTTYYWRIDEVNDANAASPWKGEVWSFWVPPKKAYDPGPADGAEFVGEDVTLSWTGGFGAKLHTVYFGDDFDTVSNASGGAPGADATFTPGTLEFDKTYYWRVDEFDPPATHKGDVWSFKTLPDIPITDPDLMGWWKLDEGEGTAALDWSGHGRHGTFEGEPVWVAGIDGGALEFDGSSYVDTGYTENLATYTIACWAKSPDAPSGAAPSGPLHREQNYQFNWNHGNEVFRGAAAMNTGGWQAASYMPLQANTWYHLAATFDGTALNAYRDGVLITSTPISAAPNAEGNSAKIARHAAASQFFTGTVDDARIYSRALTVEEIVKVMRGDPFVAWSPSPANNSTPNVKDVVPLSWSPGDNAAQHDVYFGTDMDAVDAADESDTTGVYRGRQNATTFTPAEPLEWGAGPYYWRVDEINTDGSISAGRLWTFTVADFVLVDDMESYTDNDPEGEAIWQHWIDGYGVAANGSQVGNVMPPYAEQTIVHGGRQSMPLAYENTAGVTNSEAELKLPGSRNWAEEGVTELSIWFQGQAASDGSFVEGPAGTFTMTASGGDIWNIGGVEADEFHFAYRTLTGPGSITARVQSVENTHGWAKACVMIRETLTPESAHMIACITPSNGVAAQGRPSAGGTSFSAAEGGITAPHWVKLERDVAGNFTVSHSTNGSTWLPVQGSTPQNIQMGSTVYIGLALTAHNRDAVCEAVFSNVSVTGQVSPQWTNQDIGIASNAAEPLYVAVSNATGAPAVVAHPDPGAANVEEWTEWVIPLSEFSDKGINLSDVDKIAIGLGSGSGVASSGGSGRVYIDDIRLYRPRP
ncbi:MAG: LamG domain-containing protein [Phycisphaerales bacterium]|nr:MAG: LamG domain-containing protein [Phycisphaerales bacterium]